MFFGVLVAGLDLMGDRPCVAGFLFEEFYDLKTGAAGEHIQIFRKLVKRFSSILDNNRGRLVFRVHILPEWYVALPSYNPMHAQRMGAYHF